MTETDLKTHTGDACRELMPFGLFWRHQDRSNRGYPDVSHSWRMVTSWWEFKHYDNEMFKLPPQQVITCQKLAQQAICYYVVFEERQGARATYIVSPHMIKNWRATDHLRVGFDYKWVASFIMQIHLKRAA